jgi:membrane protein YdbS with pleckstrin-like domain
MQHYSDRSFIDRYPLSPKKIWKKMVQGVWANIVLIAVFAFVFAIGLVQVYNDHEEELGPFFKRHGVTLLTVALCIFVCLFIMNYFYQRAYIKRYYYNVDDKLIIIRKGVFAQQEITVPFERIQDVYVDQDLFDVMFGLYDVHISTATATSGVRAHIDGVEKAAAEEIRKLILSKIH